MKNETGAACVIVAIDGVIREKVEQLNAGIFAEPEDPRKISDAILALVNDPVLAKTMGENGRRFVETEFDRDVMAERYLGLIRKVVLESEYRSDN